MEKYYLHIKNNKPIGCSNIPVECDDFECIECSKEDYDNYHDNLVENINKLAELTNWFDKDYTTYEQMFRRRKELGIEDTIVDEFRNKTYHNIIELYTEAEVVAKEIRELRENNSAKI